MVLAVNGATHAVIHTPKKSSTWIRWLRNVDTLLSSHIWHSLSADCGRMVFEMEEQLEAFNVCSDLCWKIRNVVDTECGGEAVCGEVSCISCFAEVQSVSQWPHLHWSGYWSISPLSAHARMTPKTRIFHYYFACNAFILLCTCLSLQWYLPVFTTRGKRWCSLHTWQLQLPQQSANEAKGGIRSDTDLNVCCYNWTLYQTCLMTTNAMQNYIYLRWVSQEKRQTPCLIRAVLFLCY